MELCIYLEYTKGMREVMVRNNVVVVRQVVNEVDKGLFFNTDLLLHAAETSEHDLREAL